MPLQDIIRNRDATGRVAKGVIEIGVHNIRYEPRKAIKSQALVDFLADWEEAQQPEKLLYLHYWSLHFDGSKNADGTGAGIVLTSPKGDKLRYVLYLDFTPCTNNMAEYEALLHGMRASKEMNVNRLRCYGDSALVAGQVAGTCDAVSPPWWHTARQWTSWVDTSQATPSSGLTGVRTRRPTHSLTSTRLDSHHPPASSSTPSPSLPSLPQGRSTSESRCNQRQPWSH